MSEHTAYGAGTLDAGIRSRFVEDINGLTMHILEAGWPTDAERAHRQDRPCLLLLHGFPELAYSWRKLMPLLADAGYHVVAPDQRGYGRTTGWDADYDGDLLAYGMLNLVRDALGLVVALGRDSVAGVIGHDFGSPVAAYSALIRPDIFRSAVMMSGPFGGPPALPSGEYRGSGAAGSASIQHELAALPVPRKHYQGYYCTRPANADMLNAPQGLHDFLRGYYHMKSADWKQNQPHPLEAWTAAELARLPNYYVMQLGDDMPATVARDMPSAAEIAACELAARRRARRLRRGIRAQRLPGRPAVVPRDPPRAGDRAAAALLRPHDRRTHGVHRRRQRLGGPTVARRPRSDATRGLHQHARLPSGRGRRSLGAAGATGRGRRAAARLPQRRGGLGCPL